MYKDRIGKVVESALNLLWLENQSDRVDAPALISWNVVTLTLKYMAEV